jgi:hypothetical protein
MHKLGGWGGLAWHLLHHPQQAPLQFMAWLEKLEIYNLQEEQHAATAQGTG